MATSLSTRRFTVEDYHKMVDAGILREGERVELIEGEIVEMTPIGRRHVASRDRINARFVRALGDDAIVRVGGAVQLSGISEPQPDLVLLRSRPDFYADTDASPGDVLLVVEVADSSLAYDRQEKARLYARVSIPDYWIADLNGAQIIVHRDPAPDGYRQVTMVPATGSVSPLAFPALSFRAGDLLA